MKRIVVIGVSTAIALIISVGVSGLIMPQSFAAKKEKYCFDYQIPIGSESTECATTKEGCQQEREAKVEYLNDSQLGGTVGNCYDKQNRLT